MRLPLVIRSHQSGGERVVRGCRTTEISSFRRGSHGLQYHIRMTGYFHIAPFAQQTAVRSDQECAAYDADEFSAVQRFLVNHIESLAPGFVGVRDERKPDRLLGFEFFVRRERVARYAQYNGLGLLECGRAVAKILRLLGTAGRVVLRIEIHDDELS